MRAIPPFILCCALAAACHDASAPTAPQQSPTPDAPRRTLITTDITDLGSLGGDVVVPGGINDFGQIVASSRDAGGTYHAFLWENGAASELPTANALLSSGAIDINNQGRIVGGIGPQVVVWENGIPTPLGSLAAGPTAASAINELGQIVGFSTNAAGRPRAVLWVNGVLMDLGTLDGDESGAQDINELGQIVGRATNAADRNRPVLWVNGTPTDLGTLGGAAGIALAINDLGQIVGSSETATTGVFHATLWQSGITTDLGTLGGTQSQAQAINQLGQIVGWSTDAGGTSHAVLWMDGSMYQIGGLAGTGDATPVAINNLGEVLGYTDNSETLVRWQVLLRAAIDALPGDATNSIKLAGAGTVNVTVFGSRYFDAAQIDARTVTLGNEDGSDTPSARKKTGQSTATLRDVNRDGYADLSLEFDKKQMTSLGDLSASTAKLVLLGSRLDGRRVRGVDKVTVQ